MKAKFLIPLAACLSLVCMTACSSESSTSPTPPTPVNPDSSSSSGDPNPTPTPTPTPSGETLPPSTVSNPALPVALYDIWKTGHVTTLYEEAAKYPVLGKDFSQIFGDYINNGLPVARVIWSSSTDSHCYIDEAQGTNMYKRGCTVSEGVGYGMLISVFREDWETYNGIWNYSKGYRNSKYASGNGLMPWLTNTFSFDIGDQASATDADLDIAASLVIAYYKTGNQDRKSVV